MNQKKIPVALEPRETTRTVLFNLRIVSSEVSRARYGASPGARLHPRVDRTLRYVSWDESC
jgi:hypothetical protein